MASDQLACKVSPPKGRHRLKIHALDPVLRPLDSVLPSLRSRKASISIAKPVNNTPTPPAKSQGTSARADIACRDRGRPTLESVAFDPFSGSQSFSELLKDPEATGGAARRTDPEAVSEFKRWLLLHFPQLIDTFQALHLIKTQPKKLLEDVAQTSCVIAVHATNQDRHIRQENDDDESIGEVSEAGCEEPWRLIFQHATVLSAEPGDIVATQGVTQSGSVYFLLNGHCDLSFRPTLQRNNKAHSSCSISPSALTSLNEKDRTTIYLRELEPGDFFGLDAAAFGFQYLLGSVTARIARQRNVLGLRETAYTYLLCLPFLIIQQLQDQYRDECSRVLPTFPYSFAPEADTFLRNTFLFRGMADSSRHFLASHLRSVIVPRSEYLFTPGQPARVFLIISGQLTLGTSREERIGAREEAELELELLQAHDSVGLMETITLALTFEQYCVVTSVGGARAYVLPSTVLLMVLAQESSALKLIHEWVAQRKSWFELRKATALARRKKVATKDSEQIVRLTLANQRRSKLPCSRCGWSGHVSTSAACVCAEIPAKSSRASSIPMLDKREKSPHEPKRAATLGSSSSDPWPVVPVYQQHPSPTMHSYRRLKVGSMALRALQIPKLSTVQPLLPNTSIVRGTENEEEYASAPKSGKEHVVRDCTLSQSLQRLEAALGQS